MRKIPLLSDNKGVSLLELILTLTVAAIFTTAAGLVFSNGIKKNIALDRAYKNQASREVLRKALKNLMQKGILKKVWVNNTVAIALGFETLAITGSGPLGSILVAQNEVLGVEGIMPSVLTPLTVRSQYDVIGCLRQDSTAPELITNADLIIPPDATEFIIPLSSPSSVTGLFQNGDIIAIQSSLGIQFVRYSMLVPTQFRVTTLGSYQVGPILRTIPAGYLPTGTRLYRVAVRMIGVEKETFSLVRGTLRYQTVPKQFIREPFLEYFPSSFKVLQGNPLMAVPLASVPQEAGFIMRVEWLKPTLMQISSPRLKESVEIKL